MKISALLFTLLITCALPTASTAAHNFLTYNSAISAFEDLIKAEAKKNAMPRQTDQEAAVLLNKLTDTETHIDAIDYESGDFADLLKSCTRAHNILLEYIFFAIRDEPTLETVVRDKNTRELELLMDRAFSAYQPEMGRLEVFVLRCNGKFISLANEFSANPLQGRALESFKKATGFMRDSTYKVYTGSIRRALNAALPIDYRTKLVAALLSSAPNYLLIFTPELREETIRHLKQWGDALDGEMKAKIDKIAEEMTRLSCTRLCSY